MADRLTVDYDVLDRSATSLALISSEFEDASKIKDRLVDSLGSGDLADAMDEFVDNWDRHRGQLLDQLKDVEGTTRSAMATFREADHKVGAVLETHGSSGLTGAR